MHGHAGHHHAHDTAELSDRRLVIAIFLNLLLSLVELIGGLLSGSLALIADATHNFNDCMSIVIALVARKVGRHAADQRRTFGYRRAEIVGAFANLILLIVIGLFLIYEAIERFFSPAEVSGNWMIGAAALALVVDVLTVVFLWRSSKGNLNLRATMLHHLSDAIASVGVMVAGVIIALTNWSVIDLLITLVIATYILWQSISLLRPTIAILMDSVPADLDIEEVSQRLVSLEHVVDIHHLHIRGIDENRRTAEAHVVIDGEDLNSMQGIKEAIRSVLNDEFRIEHSTLEIETIGEHCGTTHCSVADSPEADHEHPPGECT